MPFPGMPSGRITSKADKRSVATSKSASPRSKISRTLPEASSGKGRPSILVTAVEGRAAAISAEVMQYPEKGMFPVKKCKAAVTRTFVDGVPSRVVVIHTGDRGVRAPSCPQHNSYGDHGVGPAGLSNAIQSGNLLLFRTETGI